MKVMSEQSTRTAATSGDTEKIVTDRHHDALSLAPPALERLIDLTVEVGAALDLGHSALGQRRMVPILGGHFSGPLGQGRVLPGGADWQLVIEGQMAQLDARYVLAFDNGAQLYVHNTALRVASADTTQALMRGEVVPDAAVYFRCQPRFETSAEPLQWLMQRQFIGTGVRRPASVHLSFFTVC
jgi:Protein of unknown function (DUF3237)